MSTLSSATAQDTSSRWLASVSLALPFAKALAFLDTVEVRVRRIWASAITDGEGDALSSLGR